MIAAGGDSLPTLATRLAAGELTSRVLVESCLQRIEAPDGEGGRAFTRVNAAAARERAEQFDCARRQGASLPPFAGIPLSVKDLFDIRGEPTCAASRVLRDAEAATDDAPAVAKLRAAGFIVIGRSNMTEFAYSGLGINPNFGTPRNPWRRDVGHVPGGSSSGGAVALADGMCHASLGTDTGGSCRIPAAFCGLVGYKPTRRTELLQGSVPLAPSLDTAAVMARSVDCAAALGQALGYAVEPPELSSPARLGVPRALVLEQLDLSVSRAFEHALARLGAAGFRLVDLPMHGFARMPQVNAKGGLPAAESYCWHRTLIAQSRKDYDPRVLARIQRGAAQSAADYQDLLAARVALMREVAQALRWCDALVLPTVAIAPPTLAAMDDDAAHQAANFLSLRNTALVNFFDGCAVSLPMHEPGAAPAGLMLACAHGEDAGLLALAQRVEAALAFH